MPHHAKIIEGTLKKTAQGGIEYHLACCGEHQKSFHIMAPAKFSTEELKRLHEDHLQEVADEHASHLKALEFFQRLETGPVPEPDIEDCENCK